MSKVERDWESYDVIAALRKTGITLVELSRQSGLSSSTLSNALVRPYTKGERIIAERIGLPPEKIWPSRYKKKRSERRSRKTTNEN